MSDSLIGSQVTGSGSVRTAGGPPPQGTPGGPFPGFGPAPPAVAGTSSAGGSGLASQSDHTHAGVANVTVADAAGPIGVTTAAAIRTITQSIVATWAIGGCRVYALSPLGSDGAAGFATSADQTAVNIAAATVAAGAVAKQTAAALAAIIPPVGMGRSAIVVCQGGTYADALQVFARVGLSYATFIIRGTGTNATASSVAFSGTTNDLKYLGAQTGAGMNAAGYTAVAGSGTNTIQFTKVGGAAPGWAAEPGKPVMLRVRGDVANGTTSNTILSIVAVTASDTLKFDQAITFAGGDVFYVEEPGAIFTGSATFDSCNITFAGLQVTGIWGGNFGAYRLAFCNAGTALQAQQNRIFNVSNLFTSLGSSSTAVGPVRSNGSAIVLGGACSFANNSFGCATTLGFTGLTQYTFGNNNLVGTDTTIDGGANGIGTGFITNTTFGGAQGSAPRILGTLTFRGARCAVQSVNLPSTTAAFGVVIAGTCDLNFINEIIGGAKTDAGINASDSKGSRIALVSPGASSTLSLKVTGANGDIYFGKSNTISGNKIYSPYSMFVSWQCLCLPDGDTWSANTGAFNPSDTVPVYGVRVTAVSNVSGSTIAAGVVRSGPPGDANTIVFAQGDAAPNANGAIGVLAHSVATGFCGWVAFEGVVPISWQEGDPGAGGNPAYLSATVAGKVTVTPPAAVGNQVRQLGWSVGENIISLHPDNQPVTVGA